MPPAIAVNLLDRQAHSNHASSVVPWSQTATPPATARSGRPSSIPLPATPSPTDETVHATDQRGLPCIAGTAIDIGATEFHENTDLAAFWDTDWDGGGRSFGLEFATGTNPLGADTASIIGPARHADRTIRIGFIHNPQALGHAVWRIDTSPNLAPASWSTLMRTTNPADAFTTDHPNKVTVSVEDGIVTVLDGRSETSAFYRLAVERLEP